MELVHFDFRRLCDDYDTALIGKRVILSNTIDDLLYAVEDGIYESEVLAKMSKDTAPFWSENNEEYFWYAYVLDEDFVEKPLAEVRWFREDVLNSLARNTDRAVTDDDIVAVINDVDWEALEGVMIEHGWVVIDTAVAEYLRGIEDAKN